MRKKSLFLCFLFLSLFHSTLPFIFNFKILAFLLCIGVKLEELDGKDSRGERDKDRDVRTITHAVGIPGFPGHMGNEDSWPEDMVPPSGHCLGDIRGQLQLKHRTG